ncbi:MAG: hypothetical protein U5M51_12565 [Emticicia sp.]|nr:hypothetical protein [Emticicia sp.]
MTNCKNCKKQLNGNFCSNCGQPAKLQRIDGHYIKHEIEHVLHFEKGNLFTIKELLILAQGIAHGNSLVKTEDDLREAHYFYYYYPSLIYTLVINYFHIEDKYININIDGEGSNVLIKLIDWIKGHYGYTNIMMGSFIAFWLKLFFKKYNYNFFEILILLCFCNWCWNVNPSRFCHNCRYYQTTHNAIWSNSVNIVFTTGQ